MQTIFPALLFGALLNVPAIARPVSDPVSWTASAASREGGMYQIRISSNVRTGWHIYAMQPGGDGTLIPTAFSFRPASTAVVKSSGKPKAMTFTGVDGTAYVYEGKTEFTTMLSGAPGQTLSLTVGYQSCSEQMCLPPKKKVITIKLP